MSNPIFKIGDKVYHTSSPSIHWIIEKIVDNEAYCSTLIKETFEQKKEKFSLSSIKKYEATKIIVSGKTKTNNSW